MKLLSFRLLAPAALILLAGCATDSPDSRIAANQALFNSWPPPVQSAVRSGSVGIGFTPDQVRMALGDPSSTSVSAGPYGTTEVWFYHNRGPILDIGIGGASFGRHSAVGGAVNVGGIPLYHGPIGHVVFTNGRVSEVVMGHT